MGGLARREACLSPLGLDLGTPAQLDEVMRTGLLQLVVDRLDKDEFDVQKEAAWVLANVVYGAAHCDRDESIHVLFTALAREVQ